VKVRTQYVAFALNASNMALAARILLVALLVLGMPFRGIAKSPRIPALTPDAVTRHTLVLGGRRLAYTARAGTITLRNDQDQPAARVFYTAYTLDGADPSKRAITTAAPEARRCGCVWARSDRSAWLPPMEV
jgi:hypothetical protein